MKGGGGAFCCMLLHTHFALTRMTVGANTFATGLFSFPGTGPSLRTEIFFFC